MDFDPAFALLKNFTIGVPRPKNINEQEVAKVAKYLGLELPPVSLEQQIKTIETELFNQNGFLTNNLTRPDVENSEIYVRSQFIREIIANNRSRRGSR